MNAQPESRAFEHDPKLVLVQPSLPVDILSAARDVLTPAAATIFKGPYAQRQDAGKGLAVAGNIQWNNGFEKARENMIVATASVVLQGPASENEEAYVNSLLGESLGSLFTQDDELSFLQIDVLSAVESVRSLRRASEQLIPALRPLTHNPQHQFDLMRLLAAETSLNRPDYEEAEIQTLQVIYDFSCMDNPKPLLPAVGEKLATGEFDSFLAAELLQEIAAQDNANLRSNNDKELRKMLLMGTRFSSLEMPAVIDKLTGREMLDYWPASCKRALEERRSYYAYHLKRSNKESVDSLKEHGCIVMPDGTEEDVRQTATGLAYLVAQQNSTNGQLAPRDRLKAHLQVEKIRKGRAAHKRQRPARTGPQELSEIAADTAKAEQAPESRKLVYILPDGSEAPEDSPTYSEFMNDYFRSHSGRDGMREDVDRVLSHLKNLDLSAGLPRGVKKVNGGQSLRRGSAFFRRVYQFKPVDVVGLSLSSERGVKLRLLFGLKNDTVCLLGMEEKDRMASLTRSIGIVGRTRTK